MPSMILFFLQRNKLLLTSPQLRVETRTLFYLSTKRAETRSFVSLSSLSESCMDTFNI